MRLSIKHITRYRFDAPATYGLQQLRKSPVNCNGQIVVNWSTSVSGGRKELEYTDHFGNFVELLSFEKDASELVVVSEGIVDTFETNGVFGTHMGAAPLWLFAGSTPMTTAGNGVRALVRKVEGENDLARMHNLADHVLEAVSYETGTTTSESTAEEVIAHGKGVCQDHAHVFIAAAREMGLPARYVSGYLRMDHRTDQEATHAWAEVHLDGLGWVGFDVSNEICPDERYVRVATGLDYSGAAPVTGTRLGGEGEALSVEIEVAQQ